MSYDEVDRRIVNALVADSQAGPRDIAAETGIPATTVQKRLQDLEDDGIVDYTVDVDYEALGYDVTAVFHLSVEGNGLQAVVHRLCERDRVVGVYEVTGDYDVVAVGKFTDTTAMDEHIKELLTDPDVRAANTSVVLDAVREFERFPVAVEETD